MNSDGRGISEPPRHALGQHGDEVRPRHDEGRGQMNVNARGR
jgi:hypothetical protein